jgi:hypothetical protein
LDFDDQFPNNAVLAGYDSDYSPIFVGRAEFQSKYGRIKLPANVIPSKRECLICNQEVTEIVENFEVLITDPNVDISWTSNISKDSIVTSSEGQEKVFIGRVSIGDSMVIGNVPESEKQVYIPDRNSLISKYPSFEVLSLQIPASEYETRCLNPAKV